jgi:NAD(P)-dependent dehydrogenase (short-subunit alcohol dehydrogenase family)
MELRGSLALVTGAGSGIGRAMAVRLATRGSQTILVDVHCAGLEEKGKLVNDVGGECLIIEADVADDRQLSAAFAEATAWKEGLRIVCNNAGIGTTPPLLGELFGVPAGSPGGGWRSTLDVNLKGVIAGTELAVLACAKRAESLSTWLPLPGSMRSRQILSTPPPRPALSS